MRWRIADLNCRPRRFGYTLIEMVAGMAIMSAIMVGVGSAMLIASHALPSGSTRTQATLASADAAERLSGELYCAEGFSVRTDRSISFQVRDRDGDDIPDTLAYGWSGTPGDPLLRQMNENAAVTAVEDVHAFQLNYFMRTETTSSTSVEDVEGDEVLFAKFDDWPGIIASIVDFVPSNTSWGSEYFVIDQVTVPSDVTKVRFTRLRLKMSSSGMGTLTAAIHQPQSAGSPEPQAASLGTPATINGSLLPALSSWVDVPLGTDVVLNSRGTEFAIVVKGTSTLGGRWSYYNSSSAPSNSSPTALWTTNSGGSWNPKANQRKENDFQFYAYGKLTAPQSITTDSTRYWVQGVAITLQSGSSTDHRVSTRARVLNEPEVLSP